MCAPTLFQCSEIYETVGSMEVRDDRQRFQLHGDLGDYVARDFVRDRRKRNDKSFRCAIERMHQAQEEIPDRPGGAGGIAIH
jgi:hypothetical protein